MAGPTHYDTLGIQPDADATSVRRAYLAQARRHHPDFHAQDGAAARNAAEEQMRSINSAWHVLGDAHRRARYDRALQGAGRPLVTAGANGTSTRSSGSSSAGGAWVQAPDMGTGSAPPRWMTMAPALSLVLAIACFAVGFVTGLVGLLAMGFGLAIVGATLFVVVPMVALNRSKRG